MVLSILSVYDYNNHDNGRTVAKITLLRFFIFYAPIALSDTTKKCEYMFEKMLGNRLEMG